MCVFSGTYEFRGRVVAEYDQEVCIFERVWPTGDDLMSAFVKSGMWGRSSARPTKSVDREATPTSVILMS